MERELSGSAASLVAAARTTIRALSRQAPTAAISSALPGASARTAPVVESTDATAGLVEVQETRALRRGRPLESRASADSFVELPTGIGRAGRSVMVNEIAFTVSRTIVTGALTPFATA